MTKRLANLLHSLKVSTDYHSAGLKERGGLGESSFEKENSPAIEIDSNEMRQQKLH